MSNYKPAPPPGWYLRLQREKKAAPKKGLKALLEPVTTDDEPQDAVDEEFDAEVFGDFDFVAPLSMHIGDMRLTAMTLTTAYAELVRTVGSEMAYRIYEEEIIPLLPPAKSPWMAMVEKCKFWFRSKHHRDPSMNELVNEITDAFGPNKNKEDVRRYFNDRKPELVRHGIIPKEWLKED